ncbi:MAG TPA: tripartite tricarboxylate transporter substrate binding protein [Candidatus Sulfotelmatobacter sp.]|nr:tripartite tricarboxylate transporter substrate binding protein [Candidatus Sulfotelmatobacter sp.]
MIRTACRIAGILGLLGGLAAGPRASAADAYPVRPVHLVVPFVAGGASDSIARILGAQLAERLGQPVVIDNKGGAGGTIGADFVAKAPPDGYTLLLFHIGMIYATALYKALPFDVVEDFAPISLVGTSPSMLVVTPSLPVHTLAEFIARAKAHPGQLNYGSAGVGSSGHLAVALFQRAAGIEVTHVPYKGAGAAIAATIGGEVQFMIETLGSLVPHVKSGQLRALAMTGPTRDAALPEVPTMAEAGLPGFVSVTWFGMWAPAHTPPAVLDALNGALRDVLAADAARQGLAAIGVEATSTTRARFAEIVRADLATWGKLIRDAGIEAQ